MNVNIPAKATESTVSFNIENNILIGNEGPVNDNCINIGESILEAFKFKPDFVGQVDAETGQENTFQQMRERSVKCALWLKKFGVQRKDIVIVCMSNCLDAYIPYLACLYIGATLCVWHDSLKYYSEEHIQCYPKIIFTDFDKASQFLNLIKKRKLTTQIIVPNKECEEEEQLKSLNFILNNDFDKDEVDKFCCTKLESNKDTAVILFSSGSIGHLRKHVTIPHSFFISPSNQQLPVLLPNNIGMWIESLDWNISLLLIVRCILSSVKAIKVCNYIKRLKTPKEVVGLVDIIQKYKVNWLFIKVGMIENLYKSEFFKMYMPSLKQLLISCKIIPLRFILNIVKNSLINTSIVAAYNLPETGIIAFYKYDRIKQFFIFYMAKNVSLFFADFNNQSPLRAGNYGYIRCKSPCLTNGYYDPSTRSIVGAIDYQGWFHTIEIGLYTNKNVTIIERGIVGHVLSCDNNYKCSPLPTEVYLKMHPAVQDAIVLDYNALRDRRNRLKENTMAVIIKKENAEVTEKEIIEYVTANSLLDGHVQLRAGVRFVETLPRFLTGHFKREEIYSNLIKYCPKKSKKT